MNAVDTFALLFVALILLACFRMWGRAFRLWYHGRPLVPHEPRSESRLGLIDVLICAMLMIVVPGAVVGGVRAVVEDFGSSDSEPESDTSEPIGSESDADAVEPQPSRSALTNDEAASEGGGFAAQPDSVQEATRSIEWDPDETDLRTGQARHPDRQGIDPRVLLASSITSLVSCLVAIVIVALRSGSRIDADLGLTLRRLKYDFQLGLAAYVMLTPLVYTIQAILVYWFPSAHPLTEMFRERPSLSLFVLTGFSAVLVAPLVEEFLFRGMLQGWLERIASGRFSLQEVLLGDHYEPVESASATSSMAAEQGPGSPAGEHASAGSHRMKWWPILASSALFAGVHASHGPDPIPLFVLAVGLGYLYRQTHRLLPCVVLHALLNSTTLMALGLSVWNS